MAVAIKFDTAGRPETPTLILAKKDGSRLGAIEGATDIHFSDSMNAPSEIAFKVHKKTDGRDNPLWDEIKDFRLVYVGEWDKHFEIEAALDEKK